MIFYIGLVGSGKSTLYRKLNENKELSAVEIELPNSCDKDEKLKKHLFDIFYNSSNIDAIIAHPYYLPKDFWLLINREDKIIYLELPLKERIKRIKKRSKEHNIKENYFTKEFIEKEEQYFKEFKNASLNP